MHNTLETDIGVKIIFSMHQLVWFMKLLSVIRDRESWAGLEEPNLLRLINEDHAKLNLFSSLSVDKEPLVRNVKLQARRCRHRHSCGVQHYTQRFNVKHVKCDTSHRCSQLQYCSRFVSHDRMRGHSSSDTYDSNKTQVLPPEATSNRRVGRKHRCCASLLSLRKYKFS